MATRLAAHSLPATSKSRPFTRGSALAPRLSVSASRSIRRQAFASRPSADLAGRSVALSLDVPASFDATLASHHKAIGRWVATRGDVAAQFTRPDARRHIEQTFNESVLAILAPFNLADLGVTVLLGDDNMPPAIAIACGTIGQIDLGWIEEDNVLRNTLLKRVAPLGWRAAAYRELCGTLSCALPIFGYDDLVEEYAAYYWDGDTTDAGAISAMVENQGAELDDIDQEMLPSAMNARRPDWMLAANADPIKRQPVALRRAIRALRDAHKEVKNLGPDGNAWHFDFHMAVEYLPEMEDCSHLPAMTLVPADHFGRELDDVAQHGMQQGFMDIAGICPLPDAASVERWFDSLQVGARFLAAAQDLINLNPANM
ncbi:hypothetical protein BH10PSE14_BH10PSE14_06500 [soil metagenome]